MVHTRTGFVPGGVGLPNVKGERACITKTERPDPRRTARKRTIRRSLAGSKMRERQYIPAPCHAPRRRLLDRFAGIESLKSVKRLHVHIRQSLLPEAHP